MGSERRRSYYLAVVGDLFGGTLNAMLAVWDATLRHPEAAGWNTIIAVACFGFAWWMVKNEEKNRTEQATRESYLDEQKADTRLHTAMAEQFEKMAAAGGDGAVEFGLGPISVRKGRTH